MSAVDWLIVDFEERPGAGDPLTTLTGLCRVPGGQPGDLLSYQPNSHPRDGAVGETPPQ